MGSRTIGAATIEPATTWHSTFSMTARANPGGPDPWRASAELTGTRTSHAATATASITNVPSRTAWPSVRRVRRRRPRARYSAISPYT